MRRLREDNNAERGRPAILLGVEEPDKERETRVFSCRMWIGRDHTCDLVLDHPMVSKEHAEIDLTAGTCVLRDLDSSNGTFVNGMRVKEVTLARGDRIRIGRTEIVVLSLGKITKAPARVAAAAAAPVAQPAPAEDILASEDGVRHAWHFSRRTVLVLVAAAVLAAIGVVVLVSVKGGDDGSGARVPVPPPAATLPAESGKEPGKESLSPATPGPPVTPSANEVVLARFAGDVEGTLLERCGTCHDGIRGGQLALVDGVGAELRARLNLGALLPFCQGATVRESRLFQKACGAVPHGGGQALGAADADRIAAVLQDCSAAFPAGKGLWKPFPARLAVAGQIEPEREIMLRRVFLDLVGRPPTSAELATYGVVPLGDLVTTLVKSEEYENYWNKDIAAPLARLWGEETKEPLSHAKVAAKLAELCATRLAGRPKIGKSARQLAASLLVDLGDSVPAPDDVKALAAAIEGCGGDVLPLAVLLTGALEGTAPPPVERVYARFVLRIPVGEEKEMAEKVCGGKNGVRALVLGLASSGEYRGY